MQHFNTEITWLTLTLLMTGLFWVPYILNRMYEHGIWAALYNPQPDTQPKAQWAERMMRAHANAVENLVIFAPLVIAIDISGVNSQVTAVACIVYFFARLAHFILYSLKVPFFRTVAFLIGFFCQMTLIMVLLN